jgi:phosphatidylglycerophosphatase A
MKLSTIIASVFGIGFFDVAPGTVMSAVAVPLAAMIGVFAGGAALLLASLIVFVVGVIACGAHVRRTGREDPPECVIDELAGQWLACSACLLSFGTMAPVTHISLPAFAIAFAAFRLFDIWKPWPVSWADEQVTGGMGVMLDDMIAGMMAGAIVIAARYFLPI